MTSCIFTDRQCTYYCFLIGARVKLRANIFIDACLLGDVVTHLVFLLLPDIADGLVGVGLITQSEDMPGMLTLDKGYNDMSKFLNRILGLPVNLQNQLFKYFSDTLAAIITAAKRAGR